MVTFSIQMEEEFEALRKELTCIKRSSQLKINQLLTKIDSSAKKYHCDIKNKNNEIQKLKQTLTESEEKKQKCI